MGYSLSLSTFQPISATNKATYRIFATNLIHKIRNPVQYTQLERLSFNGAASLNGENSLTYTYSRHLDLSARSSVAKCHKLLTGLVHTLIGSIIREEKTNDLAEHVKLKHCNIETVINSPSTPLNIICNDRQTWVPDPTRHFEIKINFLTIIKWCHQIMYSKLQLRFYNF